MILHAALKFLPFEFHGRRKVSTKPEPALHPYYVLRISIDVPPSSPFHPVRGWLGNWVHTDTHSTSHLLDSPATLFDRCLDSLPRSALKTVGPNAMHTFTSTFIFPFPFHEAAISLWHKYPNP